jgi:hypothetical protein
MPGEKRKREILRSVRGLVSNRAHGKQKSLHVAPVCELFTTYVLFCVHSRIICSIFPIRIRSQTFADHLTGCLKSHRRMPGKAQIGEKGAVYGAKHEHFESISNAPWGFFNSL